MQIREPKPEDLVERALVQIRRDQQARHLQRSSGKGDTGAKSSASAARFRYLDALDGVDDGKPISEVGQAIGVDRPRASRLTTELLSDGLIERQPSPGDSRYALVRLTPQGRTLVEDIRMNRRAAVADALADFSADESRIFAELLERFVAGWPRPTP
ncbi:MAG TPA: MarR family transcriptional regulator [Pseudolysinimonas sp.]|nr:MarR family transcriptional regulator [Pseudolysinimonas sp.]